MIVNNANLQAIYVSLSTLFNKGFDGVIPTWERIATLVPSTGAKNDYKWLAKLTGLREWIGERQVKSLAAHSYEVANKNFEETVEVDRNDIEDDQVGVYNPVAEGLGHNAAVHPDILVYSLLPNGFTNTCYDGQYFFDTDHPVGDGTVSNMQAGGGNPWFLLDTSKFILPLLFQLRRKPEFVSLQDISDESVFKRRMFEFGVDYRGNAGYGLWQMAFGSKDVLNATNFDSGMATMMAFTDDGGNPLGITPTLLVVGPSNRKAALEIVKAERLANGATNVNEGTVEVHVTSRLA